MVQHDIQSLAIPCLLLQGGADPIIDAKKNAALFAGLPTATVCVFAESVHEVRVCAPAVCWCSWSLVRDEAPSFHKRVGQTFNDLNREEVFASVSGFLEKTFPAESW